VEIIFNHRILEAFHPLKSMTWVVFPQNFIAGTSF